MATSVYRFFPVLGPWCRRQVSPLEQGGASQRSSRPQQVVPGVFAVLLNRLGADISLSSSWLPQLEQVAELLAE